MGVSQNPELYVCKMYGHAVCCHTQHWIVSHCYKYCRLVLDYNPGLYVHNKYGNEVYCHTQH